MVGNVQGEWLTGCVTEIVNGSESECLRKKELRR
jgi:hypothetical protein